MSQSIQRISAVSGGGGLINSEPNTMSVQPNTMSVQANTMGVQPTQMVMEPTPMIQQPTSMVMEQKSDSYCTIKGQFASPSGMCCPGLTLNPLTRMCI